MPLAILIIHTRSSNLAIIVSSFMTGCLVFAMFGATTSGSVAVFGIFYGFFSGGSKWAGFCSTFWYRLNFCSCVTCYALCQQLCYPCWWFWSSVCLQTILIEVIYIASFQTTHRNTVFHPIPPFADWKSNCGCITLATSILVVPSDHFSGGKVVNFLCGICT